MIKHLFYSSRSLLAVCLLAAVLFTCAACKSGYPVSARNASATEPRAVKTALVAELPMEQSVTVTGTLAAEDQAALSAKVPGRVKTITVDLGSVVRKGQMIAQLEQQDYQLRLEQAEAALAQARARVGLSPQGEDEKIDIEATGTVLQARALLDEAKLKLDRSNSLLKQGVISRAQLDESEAGHKVALSRYQDAIEEIRNRQALVVQRRSELEIARQQLTGTSIYAPFDGVVQEKRTSIGEYLAAGTPIVNIVRVDPLRLRAEVPEREARHVRQGRKCASRSKAARMFTWAALCGSLRPSPRRIEYSWSKPKFATTDNCDPARSRAQTSWPMKKVLPQPFPRTRLSALPVLIK